MPKVLVFVYRMLDIGLFLGSTLKIEVEDTQPTSNEYLATIIM